MTESVESLQTLDEAACIPVNETPDFGKAIELAPGVWWARFPLASLVDHVNVYILDDGDDWLLVDTGHNSEACHQTCIRLFASEPFSAKPLRKVLVTHYHPDHIGLCGPLADRGARLITSRETWLTARSLLTCDDSDHDAKLEFLRKAGMSDLQLAAIRHNPSNTFPQSVAPLPASYQSVVDGQTLCIGSRNWKVRIGGGHAAGQVSLFSDDSLAILGDQVLLGTSSNISVHPSDPDGDLVSEWQNACDVICNETTEQTLCLPGHNQPFRGISIRCGQILRSQEIVLNRLKNSLQRPLSTIECLPLLYRRTLQPSEQQPLIGEATSLLNHLHHKHLIQRELTSCGRYVWFAHRTKQVTANAFPQGSRETKT